LLLSYVAIIFLKVFFFQELTIKLVIFLSRRQN